MRSTVSTVLRATAPTLPRRFITTSSSLLSSSSSNLPTANTNTNPTGDGGSSSPHARAKPKVYNSNISGSGSDPASQLTVEQKKEVDEHNRHFAKKQSLGKTSLGEKVDDRFWKGTSKG